MELTTDQTILFAILFFVFVFLIWGRWRYDLVAFSALLLAVVTGVVSADRAFAGGRFIRSSNTGPCAMVSSIVTPSVRLRPGPAGIPIPTAGTG